jgi:uncharacterized protein YndB with AHSA1/START domain
MRQTFTADNSVIINAPATRVWEALTRPELVREYLFGTELTADWRVGGSLTYKGQWQGKSYEDKGTVLAFVPGRLLKTTYFSSMSGLEDKPENYHTVTYELSEQGDKTKLAVTQENIRTRESAEHSAKNWGMVLEGLKKILEK